MIPATNCQANILKYYIGMGIGMIQTVNKTEAIDFMIIADFDQVFLEYASFFRCIRQNQ